MNKKVIFPGTFDPITYGHLDIIKRISLIFDNIIIAIYCNSKKKTMFNLKERIKLIQHTTIKLKNIKKIFGFNDLITNLAKNEKSSILIRGIRSISDFEYEKKMAMINKNLNPNIESIFLFASQNLSFISSSMVKKIAIYGGDLKNYIPKNVSDALYKKIKNNT
ncbi:Phosphopantetheine adenylyltransferase [Buchnera aphidicola (Eriosoma grossulariae)]|uniref:pantetheine-phosphate adenylyltransferase n=1 Tax=Buchnera aphidicola TaxID=9 RepID=UPI0034643363